MERYPTISEAAKRWSSSVSLAQIFGSKIGNNYMEIRYEDLVEDPEKEINEVCSFLDIHYHSENWDRDWPRIAFNGNRRTHFQS